MPISKACCHLEGRFFVFWSIFLFIEVFDWFVIPSPMEASFGLAGFLHKVHTWSAIFIFCAVVLHIGGVYKHTAFNQDGTLAKIVIPSRKSAKKGGRVEPNAN